MRGVASVALVLGVGGTAFADAEHYEQVRVDAGITGSSVAVADRNGTGLVVEIKEMVHDHLAIGGRVEVGVMYGGHVGDDNAAVSIAMAACALAKAEYYVGDGPIRPFAGLGLGAYSIGSETVDSGPMTAGVSTTTGRYFGVAPEVGVDLGRVRLAVTYNAIVGASIEVTQTVGTVQETTRVSQNYLSLELSFQFAGGRKAH
jgi:outer membrane protein X